jgi:uncharacterized protein with von Willebrand factor type A (vWA) domain
VFGALFRGMADVADARGDPGAPSLVQARPDRAPGGEWHGEAVPAPTPRAGGSPGAPSPDAARRDDHVVPTVASSEERLTTTDFADLTPQEQAALAPLLRELVVRLPERSSRRRRRHPTGDRLDVRATLRRSHRSGGDPAVQVRRRRRRRPRPLVALVDVSGSMEPYARVYLQLLWAAATAARAETFVFATHLTRVTVALRAANPSVALARATGAVTDWSSGTRIGAAMKAFLDRYGRRGMARGAVVLVVSDGWERDDPALLGAQMAALARLAHRIVWVNPRVAAPGFEPVVGGMAAARPYVDALVSGHTVAALVEVLDELADPASSAALTAS